MRAIALLVVISLVIAGCGAPAQQANETPKAPEQAPPAAPAEPEQPPPAAPPATTPNGTTTTTPPPSGPGPAAQEECATMSSGCGSCISKPGCGWCKTTNGCYAGTAEGPAGYVDCQQAEWAVTEEECKAPSGTVGSTCEEQFDCSHCLSGTGCKWCIQGSRCVPADSGEDCFGGWLNQSFQCSFGSR